MTKVQYSLDVPGYPLMNGVKELGELRHKVVREHWLPLEQAIKEAYDCGMVEYIFYQIWLYERAVNDVAQELGEGRQVLKNLALMLGVPLRDKRDSFTPVVLRKMKQAQNGRERKK
ncbi:MAG TPA: hypothetical protein VJJ21_02855 [Candidatus Nanoarchaeia archaeon]|nr:hypothetical protein [Candidatus Nanoarchaeia archaeon]